MEFTGLNSLFVDGDVVEDDVPASFLMKRFDKKRVTYDDHNRFKLTNDR